MRARMRQCMAAAEGVDARMFKEASDELKALAPLKAKVHARALEWFPAQRKLAQLPESLGVQLRFVFEGQA